MVPVRHADAEFLAKKRIGGFPLMFNPTADPGHKRMRLRCAHACSLPQQV